jgi:hypothetical protein
MIVLHSQQARRKLLDGLFLLPSGLEVLTVSIMPVAQFDKTLTTIYVDLLPLLKPDAFCIAGSMLLS